MSDKPESSKKPELRVITNDPQGEKKVVSIDDLHKSGVLSQVFSRFSFEFRKEMRKTFIGDDFRAVAQQLRNSNKDFQNYTDEQLMGIILKFSMPDTEESLMSRYKKEIGSSEMDQYSAQKLHMRTKIRDTLNAILVEEEFGLELE